ncbi:hypothetical protein DIPPA_09942 [Diplonema papillatum]|nr:hypothetical protein DIPPA_09942 [Diplonema papillatum]|eukprot:gene18404-28384_t
MEEDDESDPLAQLATLYDRDECAGNGRDSPRTAFLKEFEGFEKEPKRLPKASPSHAEYSSTLTMLHRTKEAMGEFSGQYSAIRGIAELPGSVELKQIVAKMFANPHDAKQISEEEWDRRQDKYKEDKLALIESQAERLGKDRVLLSKELEALREMGLASKNS